MRHFFIVSHTVPPDGQWGLDDLAGAAGRVDVVCRAVTSALFTSHGIRQDTNVIVAFAAGARDDSPVAGGLAPSSGPVAGAHNDRPAAGGPPRSSGAAAGGPPAQGAVAADPPLLGADGTPGPVAVRIRGADVQRLNPDERSTAARLRNALRSAHPDDWWETVEPGIDVAPFGLQQALDDLGAPVVWLDRGGKDAMSGPLPTDCAWVLSDHLPFTEGEAQHLTVRALHSISLGGTWYHGHHVIAVVQYLLDRQEH